MSSNEEILEKVEEYGGGYVWEPEIFAVMLMETPISDNQAVCLANLIGVHQIAINCKNLSFTTLLNLASIPGLNSLVISESNLNQEQLRNLQAVGPEIEVESNA